MAPITEIPGTLVGRFRLDQRLGGPRSAVWKAEDSERQRQVALRILTRSLPPDPARRAALLERVRQRAAFHHPALPEIEAISIEGDALVLREELIEGSPLSAIPKPLATEQLLRLAFQLADALRSLHARRIVHGALDPDHVIVVADGSFRLVGISLAALAAREDRGEERLLHSQAAADLRELSFRAPEQVSARGSEIRSDVFSLGALLYEAGTGRNPFGATTPTEIANSILRGSPPSPLELNSRLPVALIALIGRCLMKDPVKRFQDMQQLIDELRRIEPRIEDLAARAKQPSRRESSRTTDSPFVLGVLPYFDLLERTDREKAARLAARMQQSLGEAALLVDGSILDSLGARFIATFPTADAAIAALRRTALEIGEQNAAAAQGEILEPTVIAHQGAITVEHGSPAGPALDVASRLVASMEPGQMLITAPVASGAAVSAQPVGSAEGLTLFAVPPEPQPEAAPVEEIDELPQIAPTPARKIPPAAWLALASAILVVAIGGYVFWPAKTDAPAALAAAPASTAAPVDPRPQLVLEPFTVDGTDPDVLERAAALEEAVRAMLASSPGLRLMDAPATDASRFGTRTAPGGAPDQIMVYSLAGARAETGPLPIGDPATASAIAAWIAERSGVASDRIAQSNPEVLAAYIDALAARRSRTPAARTEAAASIRKAMALDPGFLPAARSAVSIFSEAGDRRGAIAAAESVVRLDPSDVATRRQLFEWSREEGNVPAAVAHGAVALRSAKADSDLLVFLARAALSAGDFETFNRIVGRLQRMQNSGKLALHPADAIAARGQLGVAVQQYYTVEPAQRQNPFLALKIGRIDVLRHSIPAAELELEKLRVLDPRYSAELLAAYLAAERRDAKGAAEALARAAEAPERGPDFHTAEAEVYAILNDHRGVLRALRSAVDSNEPTFSYILSNPLFAYLNDEEEFTPLRTRMRSAQQELRASLAAVP